jgi:NHL repeat
MIRRIEAKFSKWIMLAVMAAGIVTADPRTEAQAVPVPIADAPIVGGGTSPYCSTNIPVYYKSPTAVVSGVTYNTAGESEGDGCPGTQAAVSGATSVLVDSYGNVFFTDTGHDTLRVLYEGGAAVAQAIVNAQATPTTLTTSNLQKGHVYLIAGSYTVESGTTTVAAPASPYYCNQEGTGALANPASEWLAGCPGAYAYVNLKYAALDADGNVFFSSIAYGSGIEVFYIGGAKVQALILAENAANSTKLTTVTPGYVYHLAGTPGAGWIADGALGMTTPLYNPRGLMVDANENVIYADMEDNIVREINGTTGIVSTLAGACPTVTGGGVTYCPSAAQLGLAPGAGDGGPALSAHFNYPYAVAEDSYGNLFIADSGDNQNTTTTPATPAGVIPGRVRVVYAGGTLPGISNPVVGNIYTYAGGGTSTATNIAATSVLFDVIEGLSVDSAGYLYVTDHRVGTTTSNHIWRIDPITGIATIVVGTGGAALPTATPPATLACHSTPGPVHSDKYGSGCPGPQAYLNGPAGNYTFDESGNAYLSDANDNLIREFSYNAVFPATAVGASSAAQYIAFDVPNGSVTTGLSLGVEGSATTDFSNVGSTTNTCAAAMTFNSDTVCSFDVAFSPAAAGARLGAIQLNSAAGAIGTQFLSGTGMAGALTIDPGTLTALGSGITPAGVGVDELGNAYLVDGKAKQVLKIPTAGGMATPVVTGLGAPAQVAVDGQGTVYVADAGNNRIVRITAAGVSSYLGLGLKAPSGVAVDLSGNVYVADAGNSRVVKISAIVGAQTTVPIDAATLLSPSSLTVDSVGNLYILDTGSGKVIEVPISGGQQLVNLPSGLTPVALSVDLAGDLFVADSSSLSVIEVPLNATSGTTILSGLTTPVGLAIDSFGSLYLADAAKSSITAINRIEGAVVFQQTDIKATTFSTSPLTLTSAGNLNVTLSTPLFTETGSAAFPVTAPSTGACIAGAELPLGESCQEIATFHPTTTGNLSSVVTFPSSGSGVTANLSGVSVNLTVTSLSVLQTAPATGTVYVGQSATVSATVVPTATTTQPSGTISITVDGGTPVVLSMPSSGSPTVSTALSPNVGTHVVKACYSGDSVYVTSCGMTTIVVVLNPTTAALAETATLVSGAASGVILTATIASATNTSAITGSVTFTNGTGANSVALGTATVSGGIATLTSAIAASNSSSYTACYSGSAVFGASCITISGTPDYIVLPMVFPATTPATTSLGVPEGGQSLATFTVVPLNGYVGNLTGSCTNLPQDANCRFSVPATMIMAPAAGAAQVNSSVSVQIFTGVNPNTAMLANRQSHLFAAILFGWPATCALALSVRRRRSARALGVLLAAGLLFVVAGFSGCGSNTNTTTFVTPAGTSNITVTLVDANNLSHSVTLPITVVSSE